MHFNHILKSLSRAISLPLIILPIAAVMLTLGSIYDIPLMIAIGEIGFANIGIIISGAVAMELVETDEISPAIGAVIAQLVIAAGVKSLGGGAVMGISSGIFAGIFSATVYNFIENEDTVKNKKIIFQITNFINSLIFSVIFGYIWKYLHIVFTNIGEWVVSGGKLGLFVYGFLNRILVVFGLHNAMNDVAWREFGEFAGAKGDLHRFFAGDPTAGVFMSGFFIIMIFGMPGAALAMYMSAKKRYKKDAAISLAPASMASLCSGITEAIDFAFIFASPVLLLFNAVATGLAMVVANLFDLKLGFQFSAGLIDYFCYMDKATHPLLLLPIGLVFFGIYFSVFYYYISHFGILTPGRYPNEIDLNRIFELTSKSIGSLTNIKTFQVRRNFLVLEVFDSSLIDPDVLKENDIKCRIMGNAVDLEFNSMINYKKLLRFIKNAILVEKEKVTLLKKVSNNFINILELTGVLSTMIEKMRKGDQQALGFKQLMESSDDAKIKSSEQHRISEQSFSKIEDLLIERESLFANIEATQASSNQSLEISRGNIDTVVEMTSRINEIQKASVENALIVDRLIELTGEIEKLTGAIDDISDETGLLALNATIEAARAGKESRGFAVIADEIRQLSAKTDHETAKIGTLLTTIADETKKVKVSTDNIMDSIDTGMEKNAMVNDNTNNIISHIEGIKEKIDYVRKQAEDEKRSFNEIVSAFKFIKENSAAIELQSTMNFAAVDQLNTSLGEGNKHIDELRRNAKILDREIRNYI